MTNDSLTGSIERITYYNPDNGYTVLKILPDKKRLDAAAKDGTVAVVGIMPELSVGESVEFSGAWINDARYGKQFKAETVKPVQPTSKRGITRYLASGIVRGIGPATAERIVDHFGTKTLDILNHQPERIHEVPGLKTSLANELIKAWSETQGVRNTMIFLQGYGISTRIARRIHETWGEETIPKLQEDPYRLADDVFGIGFIKADQIARNMGIPVDSPGRLRAGLQYALNKLASDGHTFAPRELLLETAMELLGVDDRDEIETMLNHLVFTGELEKDTLTISDATIEAFYLPMYYRAEVGAAKRLKTLAETPSEIQNDVKKLDWEAFLSELAEESEVSLTRQQQSAVQAALEQKVSVLTGGPGTGKTTTLRMVIEALEALDIEYLLASPTGRAAKRLSEATGRDASTIHRMLGWTPGEGFTHDEDAPLKAEMLIVDEASMIDLLLFHSLLKAIKPTAHLLLVGDVDQLPSVGAGNVLNDVINSGIAFVTRLKTIFRQDEQSLIVANAHRINNGEMPEINNRLDSDFFFFDVEDPLQAAEMVVDVVKNRVPNRFGYDPLNDVQVIAPMYRGPAGVHALNELLQQALNPGKGYTAEKKVAGRTFRVGDKVMQTRNNYDQDVFNGDIGRVAGIDYDYDTMEVTIDGRFIDYDPSTIEDLIHAYCISTHRSQGSEYPAVVMVLLTQHYMMLQRNLLYTALTRAKRLVVLVGSRRALQMAVRNNKVAERFTGLAARLGG